MTKSENATQREVGLIERITRIRIDLEQQLRDLGAPIPKRMPFDDAVTYNNTLREAVEDAQAARTREERENYEIDREIDEDERRFLSSLPPVDA